ncbi:cellulose binding domain-containing protein [Glycomyces sp. L485]|uniref:rhamnogalacturonan lyase family protein n=1 Tax=Glycomyces sp. L485 TaxID=2909235 RepID=UPI001F4B507A|nr:cellulose binding domain-containing protein [Glycomyces sp. L485]MCH7232807.1 cellulose binding domain-containing protein [Glycomyces sp. L485]
MRIFPRRRWKAIAAVSAAALAVTLPAAWAVSAQAATGCEVTYTVSNEWPGGFTAAVKATNLGDPVTSWTVGWNYDSGQQVTSAWNADVSQSGSTVTATNMSYNGSVVSGGAVEFGFNGSWSSSNPEPSSFTFNGTTCDGSDDPTDDPTDEPTDEPTNDEPTDEPTDDPTGEPGQGGDGRYEVEALTRGVTVVPSGSGRLVSWRLLGTDDPDVAFNVYRDGAKLNSSPITGATNHLDSGGSSDSQYTVRAVTDGSEGSASAAEAVFNSSGYLDIPIQRPSGGTTPSGESYSYEANDASVADLDGDGTYEYILKWYPSNAHDNAHDGYTGNTYIDAYRQNGQRLWRIDLGRNIRSGAHYTQFQVYDYDGDGTAEIAVKTADGTRDGDGTVIGSSSADHRNSSGRVLAGPEFLTIFDGQSGAAMDTIDYQPARGNVSSWGDNYGNRVDRFLAGTAYLDGETPSMIFSRGYYTRSVIWAVDWNGSDLSTRWIFDSDQAGSQYEGQGAHSLSIADLDGDGRQDVVFGAMAIGSNGQALWNTRMYHGDALHVSDFMPDNPGQEVFMPGEHSNQPSSRLVDGDTGSILFQTSPTGDNGRAVAANVSASNPGAEFWSSQVSGLLNASGQNIGSKPGSINFLSWWDGDGERELLDGTRIDNYSPGQRLLTGSGVASNNGTKSTPAISADLFGDWREEVVWRTSDSSALRIYSTPHETDLRIPTLMHDIQYRVAIAWQNTAYNQPPHPSFYIGSEVTTYPWPDVHTP